MAGFFSSAKDKILNALKKTGNMLVGSATGLFMGIGASLSAATSVGFNTLWVKPVSALYDRPNRLLKGLGIALGIVMAPISAVTVIASYIPAIPIGAIYGMARGGQVAISLPASAKISRCANKALETIIEDERRITTPHEKNINKRLSSWLGNKAQGHQTRINHPTMPNAEPKNDNKQRQNNANHPRGARQQPENKGLKKARVVIAPQKIPDELPLAIGRPRSNNHHAAVPVRPNPVILSNVREQPVAELPLVPGGPQNKSSKKSAIGHKRVLSAPILSNVREQSVDELPLVPGGPQNKSSKKSAIGHKRVLSASLKPIAVKEIANRKDLKEENNVSSSSVKDKPKSH